MSFSESFDLVRDLSAASCFSIRYGSKFLPSNLKENTFIPEYIPEFIHNGGHHLVFVVRNGVKLEFRLTGNYDET